MVPTPAAPLSDPVQLSLTREGSPSTKPGESRRRARGPAQRARWAISDEPFYTVAELATRLALSERTVRDMLNRGEIPCCRIGPQRRIDPDDLRRWLEQRKERR